MKVRLLYPDRDFDAARALPPNEATLIRDLELETLFGGMAAGDPFLFEIARHVVLAGETDIATILYRQSVLADCRANAAVARAIYALVVEAIERENRQYWYWPSYPRGILHRSVEVLRMLVETLKRIRSIADGEAHQFHSQGFRELFSMLAAELGDAYLAEVERCLGELKFRDGVSVSATLGRGNKGTGYVLLREDAPKGWRTRIFGEGPSVLTHRIDHRDENGAREAAELADRGINLIANALAQSAEHILGFLRRLRTDLAFYVGCLNLEERLAGRGGPVCFPVPAPPGGLLLSFTGLGDVCLALTVEGPVVGNDVNADGKRLAIVTGANRGGKSTFLRSVGLAQLMMQAGMFVAADSFCADICAGVFTHHRREEDATMKSGKLDEELGRMSEIVDMVGPGCMVLFNDSFAATNEREGSEIAGQIVGALLERDIRVLFVTHMFELASRFREGMERAIFLRAERDADGERSFKVVEGQPLPTSFGEDLYRKVFSPAPMPSRASLTPIGLGKRNQ